MSTHITGKLITVGNYTEEEEVDHDNPLARAVVVMPREALKAVCSLPMYEDVLIVKAEEWDQLRAENAALRERLHNADAEIDMWASRCAAAIWMLPEQVTGGQLREAQDKFHRMLHAARKEEQP